MKTFLRRAGGAVCLLVFIASLGVACGCGDDDDDDQAPVYPKVGPWSFTFQGTSSGEGSFDLSGEGEVSGEAAGIIDGGLAFQMQMTGTLDGETLMLDLDGLLSDGVSFTGKFWGELSETAGTGRWSSLIEPDSTGHGTWEARYTG